MLDKLLGVGSFGGSIGHLAHHHAIHLASLGGFNIPFVVWIIALVFLRCWALITLASVTHFQQDDHIILLDAIAHVETNIFSF
jgi:hypothetical protein